MAVATTEERVIQDLRRYYEAYSRGDFDSVSEMAHPEIVVVRAGGQGEIRGAEAVRAWLEPDALEFQILEPVEFRLDGSKVLVHLRGTMRGAGSGLEMDIGAWSVWTFDDSGRFTRVEVFLEHEEDEAQSALRSSA
jgi:ketosteroid isomerase-like protein